MVNDVLTAMSTQLYTKFGDSKHYYVENIEQNLIKPCFTLDAIIPLQRATSPLLYKRTIPVVIHYHSDDKNDTKCDSYEIAEQTIECLEYLPFNGGIIRGEDISWQMVDDVLQIFITYRFTTRKVTPDETDMEILKYN